MQMAHEPDAALVKTEKFYTTAIIVGICLLGAGLMLFIWMLP